MSVLDLKFGWIRGGKASFSILMTDAEAVAAQSGRFLTRNASTGYAEIADTTESIIGFAEAGGDIASTSSQRVNCIFDVTAVFRIPLIYDNSSYTVNYSSALMFEGCDFKVSGGVQYANPTSASTKSIIIIGGKAATGTSIVATDGYIDCIINPNAILNLGVGA